MIVKKTLRGITIASGHMAARIATIDTEMNRSAGQQHNIETAKTIVKLTPND